MYGLEQATLCGASGTVSAAAKQNPDEAEKSVGVEIFAFVNDTRGDFGMRRLVLLLKFDGSRLWWERVIQEKIRHLPPRVWQAKPFLTHDMHFSR